MYVYIYIYTHTHTKVRVYPHMCMSMHAQTCAFVYGCVRRFSTCAHIHAPKSMIYKTYEIL